MTAPHPARTLGPRCVAVPPATTTAEPFGLLAPLVLVSNDGGWPWPAAAWKSEFGPAGGADAGAEPGTGSKKEGPLAASGSGFRSGAADGAVFGSVVCPACVLSPAPADVLPSLAEEMVPGWEGPAACPLNESDSVADALSSETLPEGVGPGVWSEGPSACAVDADDGLSKKTPAAACSAGLKRAADGVPPDTAVPQKLRELVREVA